MKTKSQILGPFHYGDLKLNMALRLFLKNFSTPIRYASGLCVGLVLGALYAQYFAFFVIALVVLTITALIWVIASLYFKSVVRDALSEELKQGENLSEFEQIHSRSWAAAVKVTHHE